MAEDRRTSDAVSDWIKDVVGPLAGIGVSTYSGIKQGGNLAFQSQVQQNALAMQQAEQQRRERQQRALLIGLGIVVIFVLAFMYFKK
jgi:hypothetical protein